MAFRDGPFENLKVPLAWTAAAAVAVGLIGAVLLLLGDRRGEAANPARGGFDAVLAPVSSVLAAPVRWTGAAGGHVGGYFFAVSENRRLRRENEALSAWRDEAIALKNVNRRYEAMLGMRADPPVPMATGRTIADSRGPFANARLIDIGSGAGVRVGHPVASEHGLVGRIIGLSPNASRMLLLTDVASQVPVLVDRTDARAILKGDASANPRLEFVRGDGAVQAGDRVLTSGDGGGLPRGLPVGVVARGVDGSWRVKLFSDRGAIDLVRVLLFQSFGQLVAPEALNAPPLSGLALAPPPAPPPAPPLAAAPNSVAGRPPAPTSAATPAAVSAPAPVAPAPIPAAATPAPALSGGQAATRTLNGGGGA